MLIDSNSVLDTNRMGGYLGIRNIRMLTYMQDIAALVSARIIRVSKDSFESGYQICPKALAAYMNNEPYVPVSDKNLSTKRLVARVGEVLRGLYLKSKCRIQNLPLCHFVTSFLPETGTLLSASQTFPLTGEFPFRGAKTNQKHDLILYLLLVEVDKYAVFLGLKLCHLDTCSFKHSL